MISIMKRVSISLQVLVSPAAQAAFRAFSSLLTMPYIRPRIQVEIVSFPVPVWLIKQNQLPTSLVSFIALIVHFYDSL